MSCRVQIIGDAAKAASFVSWARKQWTNMEYGHKTWHMDGVIIEAIKNGEDGIIRIMAEGGVQGFLTHPRRGTPRGFQFPGHSATRDPFYGIAHTGIGYRIETDQITGDSSVVDDGDATGTDGFPYPLIAEDERQYLFSEVLEEKGVWTAEGPQELVYGNVDWKGPVTDDPADREILTYKGNPSRYWPVDNFCEIPGLSSVDHSVEGLLNSYEYMTVFGDKVYQNGEVLAEMPWLYHPLNTTLDGWEANHQNARVLGAAIRQSDELLICVVKTCYNSYPRLKAAAGQDGFLVSAWHTYKSGVVYKDWLDDKAGAEKQVADSKGALTLVEMPDPGRGYFVELIVNKAGNIPGGWTRLYRSEAFGNMPNTNWFFSEDGTKVTTVLFDELYIGNIFADTVTFTKTSVGGFKNRVESTTTIDTENNLGEQDPSTIGGEFGASFRVGVASGDWVTKTDTTRKFKATKHGSTILASDYNGNSLLRMKATIGGDNSYDYFKRFGFKWGYTALPPALHMSDEDRTPQISLIDGPLSMYGEWDGVIGITLAGACQPVVTISGVVATPREDSPYIFDVVYPSASACSYLDITAHVIDLVSGRTDSSTGTYYIPAAGSMIDSEETTCSYSGTSIGYTRPSGGAYYKVTLAISDIPLSLNPILFEDIISTEYVQTCYGCHNSESFTAYNNITPNDKYYYYNGLIYTVNNAATYATVYTRNNAPRAVKDIRVYETGQFNSLGPYVRVEVTLKSSGTIYCSNPGYCSRYYNFITWAVRPAFCYGWLSDSYKTGLYTAPCSDTLIDADALSSTHKVKVAKVERYAI